MSKQDAVAAYRDSLYNALEYKQEARIGSRSVPLIGGIWPALKLIGNGLVRPFKVGGALLFGHTAEMPTNPAPPQVPEEFRGSNLGKAFEESWELRTKSIEARTAAFGDLLNLEIGKWWKKSSVASFDEAKDRRTVFPEEGEALDHATYGNRSWAAEVGSGLAARAIGSALGGGRGF